MHSALPTRRRHRAVAAASAAFVLLAAACGDSDSSESPSTTGEATTGSTVSDATVPEVASPTELEVNPDCAELVSSPNVSAIVGDGPVNAEAPTDASVRFYSIDDADAPAAVVAGQEISALAVLDDVEAQLVQEESLNGGISNDRGAEPGSYTTAVTAQTLDILVFESLVNRELAARAIVVDATACEDALTRLGAPPAGFDAGFLERVVARQAAVEALAADLIKGEALEVPPCVRHILVETAEEAEAVFTRLDAGEEFGAIAMEVSTDPGSGAEGGVLGCQPLTQWVPEFANALAELEVGERSGAVQSDFGFHIIERIDTIEEWVGTAEIEAKDRALQEWAMLTLPTAEVEIDERIGTWNSESATIEPAS
jgi:hypothetical protein